MAGGVISSLMYSVGFKFNNKGIRNAQTSVDRLSDRVEKLGKRVSGIAKGFLGLASAIGGIRAAGSLFEKTIGGAMQLEQTQMQINALVGSVEKGQEVFNMVNNMGLKSVFSEEDFLNAGKAFLPITKNVKELNYMLGVTERLASANPLEGMEGAAFSMKELASGDIASVAERFNIGKSDLRTAGFSSTGGAMGNIKALDKVLTNYGYTAKYVNEVNQSGAAQWDMLQSNVGNALKKSGTSALNLLKGPLSKINQWMGSGGLDKLSEMLSKTLARIVELTIQGVTKASDFITRIRPQLENFVEKFRTVLSQVVSAATNLWTNLQPIVTNIYEIGSAFVKWEGFIPVVAGLAAAFVTYRAITISTTAALKIHELWTKRATIAQKLLNIAMKANLIGIIITAIIALVTALVVAYKKSETFRNFIDIMWAGIKKATSSVLNFFVVTVPNFFKRAFNAVTNFLKKWGSTILVVLGGPLVWIGALIYKNWDKIKAVTISVFTAVKNWLSNTWNSIVTFVKNAARNLVTSLQEKWNKIKTAANSVWTGIKDGVMGMWQGIKGGFISGINWVIGKLNDMIYKVNNALSVELPDWMGGGINVSIPTIPTIDGSHANGLARVPWDGYIAQLHKGERVLTAEENRAYTPESAPARSSSSGRVGNFKPAVSITVQGNADSNTVASLREMVHEELQDILESYMRIAGLGSV